MTTECVCGAPVECPKWIIAGVRTCEPYPCGCNERPDWSDTCWWRNKVTGRISSRCTCWGRPRDDRLPSACCSRDPLNPLYAHERPAEAPDVTEDPPALDEPATEYTRRWTHAELHCPCPTPWDNAPAKAKVGGFHCCACHINFRSLSVAAMHQKSIFEPCRPPPSIVDIGTGRPLLRMQSVGEHIVWG